MNAPAGPGPRPRVSVVVPARREGAQLARSLARIAEVCGGHFETFEILTVIDGPDAETLGAVEHLGVPGLEVLVNPRNRGKGFSVRRGMLAARGSCLLFIDADLSPPIERATSFVQALEEGADVVIASRALGPGVEAGPRAFGRAAMSRAFNAIVQRTFLPGIGDSQCGFKGFRRDAARRLFAVQRIDRFAFDVEVLWLARRWGYRIAEVPVKAVDYRQSSVRRSVDSMAMLRDLARIRANAALGRYGDRGATGDRT